MAIDEILRSRLFGYAILFRARWQDGAVEPVVVDPQDEAQALSRELQHHVGQPVGGESDRRDGEIGVSVPFGRCGIDGVPCEHVRMYNVDEAWIDRLTAAGLQSDAVSEGETLLVEPGSFVRFRGRPRSGHRVLVAFQTEDRSPLAGHAAPLSLADEPTPADAGPRLATTSRAFQTLADDPDAAAGRLQELFEQMRGVVTSSDDVAHAQQAARQAGSYDLGAADEAFDAARALLNSDVIGRVARSDEALFRFPGMFGAVAPLFPLLEE